MSRMIQNSPLTLSLKKVRQDFPALQMEVYGKPLVYLDNAATTQKPQSVIDSIVDYYHSSNANVHRGIHFLSERATESYETARTIVQQHINAPESSEIIFVRGTTEAINLVAQSYGRSFLREGDEVLITWLEHHSNIVPWQLLRDQVGIKLVAVPIDDRGQLQYDEFERLLNERTRLVSVAHVSNALGTINPVKQMIRQAHQAGALVLVDGAQAAPHLQIDVQDLDCDFYAFSGHKVYGPTGIGVLFGKRRLLEEMPPYQGGGEMISAVTLTKTIYNQIPHKFEAGTPHISGTVGLGAALRYLDGIGMAWIGNHETELLHYATDLIQSIPGVRLIGTASNKSSVISFIMEGIHAHDLGTILDREGIAIRAGHHCAMPVMDRFGVPATIRASLGLYNTKEDIDSLAAGLHKARNLFGI